jgi:hypothetical protein
MSINYKGEWARLQAQTHQGIHWWSRWPTLASCYIRGTDQAIDHRMYVPTSFSTAASIYVVARAFERS